MPQYHIQQTYAPVGEITYQNLDGFTRAYVESMFWTEHAPGVTTEEWQTPGFAPCEGSIPDDVGFSDLAPDALAAIIQDCADFQALESWRAALDDEESEGDETQGGHDFWLTRNRHGAGFWDRGRGVWPANGKPLTDDAHACGEASLYLGDDGKVYAS